MLYFLVFTSCALLGQTEAAADQNQLSAQVRKLVIQLDSKELKDREEAEAKLISLGTRTLDLLPLVTEKTPEEVMHRLTRVKAALEKVEVDAFAQPRTITLHEKLMPVSEMLAVFEEQTGNRLIDLRQQRGQEVTDLKLDADFDNVPFWQALDQVLDRAELTTYNYVEEPALGLIAVSEGDKPRHARGYYVGPFRLEPLRITAQRDLRAAANQSLNLLVELAWEPRLSPIAFQHDLATLLVVDDKGRELTVDREIDREIMATTGNKAIELQIPLGLPPRDASRIASLKGKLMAITQGKTETFEFTDLEDSKGAEQRKAGATVTFDQARKNNQLWELRVRVRFDETSGALESHRGWVFQNEANLIGPNNKPVESAGFETTRHTRNEVGAAYFFEVPKGLAGHKFVYKTAASVHKIPIEYELKDIPLP